MYEEALRIQRKMLGEGHPSGAATLNKIAIVQVSPGIVSAAGEGWLLLSYYRLSRTNRDAFLDATWQQKAPVPDSQSRQITTKFVFDAISAKAENKRTTLSVPPLPSPSRAPTLMMMMPPPQPQARNPSCLFLLLEILSDVF